jgi:potassium uptake TrkH family protein
LIKKSINKIYELSPIIERVINILFSLVSLIAIMSLIAQYGFYLSVSIERWLQRLNLVIILFFVLQFLLKALILKNRKEYIRSHWLEAILATLITGRLTYLIYAHGLSMLKDYFLNINMVTITQLTIVGAQIAIILSIISSSLRLNQKIASLKFHPAQTLLLSFLVVILIGAMLLMLPKSTVPGCATTWMSALFTSTSATCVTGLIVVDTGTHFTLLGQIIILALIQIGGLGIMTLSSFLAVFFGRGIAIKERVLLQDMLSLEGIGMISKVLRIIVLTTFGIEALGASILFFAWNRPEWLFTDRLYHSIFHAISAFCNAGFSLNHYSLMDYYSNSTVLITIASLIIFGGLGFVVMIELTGGGIMNLFDRRALRRWSVQTKLVLITSLLLIVTAAAFIYFYEPLPGTKWQRIVNAFFTAVTPRTAGYNSIDFGLLSAPSALLIIMLMFIGGSPGSTAGGIKTTTLGVLSAGLYSFITGKNRITLFHRNIPFIVLNRSLVVFSFALFLVVFSTFLLSITEKAPILDLFFEEVSAFGTVGLSRGITFTLTEWGKLILIISMYIGRVGPLTMALAITTPTEHLRFEYPSEKNIMVG